MKKCNLFIVTLLISVKVITPKQVPPIAIQNQFNGLSISCMVTHLSVFQVQGKSPFNIKPPVFPPKQRRLRFSTPPQRYALDLSRWFIVQ